MNVVVCVCRICGHRLTKQRLPREKRSRWIDAWGSLNGVDGHRHKRVMPSKTYREDDS